MSNASAVRAPGQYFRWPVLRWGLRYALPLICLMFVAPANSAHACGQDGKSESRSLPAATCHRPIAGFDFRWPAQGKMIIACWAEGDPDITLALPSGTSVRAAEAGTVTYAGKALQGRGSLIIIRHSRRFASLYAGDGTPRVGRGDRVGRGQVIAAAKASDATAPQLHFELRRDGLAVDPRPYLPCR